VPSPAFFAVLNGGSGVTATKPTMTYTSTGTFTVTNYDPQLAYTAGASGAISTSTFTVTVATGTGTLYATSPKGSAGSTTTGYRHAVTQTFTQTGDPYVDYSPSPNGGTFYDTDQWNPTDGSPAGYYAVITPGYYTNDSYTGSGYTFSSTYNEWWKIV